MHCNYTGLLIHLIPPGFVHYFDRTNEGCGLQPAMEEVRFHNMNIWRKKSPIGQSLTN